MTLEEMILENLIANEDYSRKVLPFIKKEYFEDETSRLLFQIVQDFIVKYNQLPPKRSVELEIHGLTGISQTVSDDATAKLQTFSDTPDAKTTQWMIDQSEKWCQERSIYIAISESIQIMDGRSKNPKTAIPQLLSDALAVAFDSDLGHDYTEDSDARYDYIHSDIPRIQFDLDMMNKITQGGVTRKTFNLIGAGINVGKTLQLCHYATAYALQGYKVLYISLEMSQEEIAARLDANLMDVDINKIKDISRADWDNKIATIRRKAKSNILIKEYPTRGASVIQFRAFLRELKIKKSFIPDIVMIDYIGICSAAKLKLGGTINTNTYQGQVAAELRGLAIENKIAVWSACQLNRAGIASSDPEMTDSADSIDVSAIADFYIIVTESEELAKLSQYQVKQVKSRYGDKNIHKRFVIGVDKTRMRLYDVSASAQTLSGSNKASAKTTSHSQTSKTSTVGNGPQAVFKSSNNPRNQGSDNNDKFSKFTI